MMFTLLLIGMLALVFRTRPVEAAGTIYIRPDGSVEPESAPILRNGFAWEPSGSAYVLTSNITFSTSGIVIEADNAVIFDGDGHMIEGSGVGAGIAVLSRANVEIMNLGIRNFESGIRFESSTNGSLSATNIEDSMYGIRLSSSSNNNIFANNIENNTVGIMFTDSSDNRFYDNNFVENKDQVLDYSQNHSWVPISSNLWDDGYGFGGNYWSDYTGKDADGNGIGDVLYAIDSNNVDPYPLSSSNPLQPGYYETSEYLIGTVAVGVVLLESNGKIDPETENWTSTEEADVVTNVTRALDWLAASAPTSAYVSFTKEVNYRVATSYEPVSRSMFEDCRFWIAEAMKYLGYRSVLDYVNNLRNRLHTTWAFTLFVVDASNDSDGWFADGADAHGPTGGPYVIMTNTALASHHFDLVFAHETCHTFFATDEYNSVVEFSGYLNVSDTDNIDPCIMGPSPDPWYESWLFCEATEAQLGWRDTDGDGLLDIVDSVPNITLDDLSPSEPTNGILIFNGSIAEVPHPNLNPYIFPQYPWSIGVFFRVPHTHQSMIISTIVRVEYRWDYGLWTDATPLDLRFDEAEEGFTFTVPWLFEGIHILEIRGLDSFGNTQTLHPFGRPPNAEFEIDPVAVIPNEQVTFNASGSISFNGSMAGYEWDFGDGQTDSLTIPVTNHTYTSSGSYKVTLKVTDSVGLWNITAQTLMIYYGGDLNKDGSVDLYDAILLAAAYNSSPNSSNWNVVADINSDNTVDIYDAIILANNFGKTA